jgi:hypothetical protein
VARQALQHCLCSIGMDRGGYLSGPDALREQPFTLGYRRSFMFERRRQL